MIGGSRTVEPGNAQLTRAACALACALPLLLPALCFGRAAWAQDAPRQRFLLIHSQDGNLAANVEATAGVVAGFDPGFAADYEIYAEYCDDQGFPGAEADQLFTEQLARRYRGQHFDAILAFDGWAPQHVVAQRAPSASTRRSSSAAPVARPSTWRPCRPTGTASPPATRSRGRSPPPSGCSRQRGASWW